VNKDEKIFLQLLSELKMEYSDISKNQLQAFILTPDMLIYSLKDSEATPEALQQFQSDFLQGKLVSESDRKK
jgi:hypothetical protein